MIRTLFICVVLKLVNSQLNGEFWWLNDKVAKYNRALITPPMVEELSEFDNDENSNIVFRDDNRFMYYAHDKSTSHPATTTERIRVNTIRHGKDSEVKFGSPVQGNIKNNKPVITNYLPTASTLKVDNPGNSNKRNDKELSFVFPDDDVIKFKEKFEFIKNISNVSIIDNNQITTSVPEKPPNNERPKFHNVDVTNIQNKVESKNIFPITLEEDKLANTTKLSLLPPKNEATNNYQIYTNKINNDTFDRPKFGNVDVTNIESNLFKLSNNDKQMTEKTFTKKPFNNNKSNNKTENNFIFPTKDRIIWNNFPIPSKTTEIPWTSTIKKLDAKPKFYNINVDFQNNNAGSAIEQKTTKAPARFKDTNQLHKQDNQNFLTDKYTNAIIPQKGQLLSEYNNGNNKTTSQVLFIQSSTPDLLKFNYSKSVIFGNDQVEHGEKKEKESQNICTYMKKNECQLRKGFIYTVELQSMLAKKAHDPSLICCILPSPEPTSTDSKVIFNNPRIWNRRKRSSNDETKELTQRKFLLQRFSNQSQNIRLPATNPKIVTSDDDYADPYWNIKTTKFHETENTHTKYDYSSKDYIEDYVDELPRPGLIGIYSVKEQKKRKPTWNFGNRAPVTTYGADPVYDSVESDETFGYSTVDPRKVVNSKSKTGKPQKLSTISTETPLDPESQIIHFKSSPDFRVFQGFKLMNVMKKKNKETKTPVTDIKDITNTESKESDEKSEDSFDSDIQKSNEDDLVHENCGRAVNRRYKKDKQVGEADSGTHPWLALVVETKRRQNILCYATIIHPRGAITAAECVSGTTLGELTLIAGVWNLNERTRSRSRVVSVYIHPKYEPGDMANDLAILYWQQPLRLGVNVQPACLANRDEQDGCMFFGWGGFGQVFHIRSRWQRSTIRECKNELLNKQNDRQDMFCASAPLRNSVVGLSSPLICNIEGRHSIIGIVVANEQGLVLLHSAHHWPKQAIKKLRLN